MGMSSASKWIDLTDDLTEKGKKELQVGQVLLFEKVHLRIMRKYKGKVWAKRVVLQTLPEFNNMMRLRAEAEGHELKTKHL
jgi:hypothetical protein